jgi:heterodisulfide reductase subunit B
MLHPNTAKHHEQTQNTNFKLPASHLATMKILAFGIPPTKLGMSYLVFSLRKLSQRAAVI